MKSVMVPDDLHKRLILAKIQFGLKHTYDVIIVRGDSDVCKPA